MNAKESGTPGRRGFTLLELVAVIGIIAIMGTIVVGGFNVIVRALSQKTGADDLRRSLNLARQSACVDGKATILWITGVDRYVVARESGTVSRREKTGTHQYEWGGGTVDDLRPDDNKNVWWIFDEYADLSDSAPRFKFDDDWGAEEVKSAILGYKNAVVFDMDENVSATVVVPAMLDRATDSWYFGVAGSNLGSGAFAQGHDYGWLVYPELSLPKGFAFNGTWKEDGSFDTGKRQFVRFRPDGSAEQRADFEIYEFSTKQTVTVSVSADGKIK